MPSIRTSTPHHNTSPPPQGASPAVPRGLTPARLNAWVERAQPNAKLTYGEGINASQCVPEDLRERARELSQRGWLTTHFVRGRDGAPNRQVVMRTNRPFLKGSKL